MAKTKQVQEYYLLVDNDGVAVMTLDEIMLTPEDFDGTTFLRVDATTPVSLDVIPEQIRFEPQKLVPPPADQKKTRKPRHRKYHRYATEDERNTAKRLAAKKWYYANKAKKASEGTPVTINRIQD